MRGALVVGVALLLAAPASADVLVPADPPQTRSPIGLTAAGDLIAFALQDGIDAFAGTARVRIAGVGPGVAAASDGTAVLAAVDRGGLIARVRRPGDGFGKTVRLGSHPGVYALAAAPGGWTAAAWARNDRRGIEAAGGVQHARVDRGRDRFSIPVVGIDARGFATVAWTRGRRVRFARSDGRDWTLSFDAGRDATPASPEAQYAQVALAVTPGGHRLLAWPARTGIRASVDDAAPRTLAAARSPRAPAAALAEDGSAVIAYSASSEILAVDRAQGGPWSAPHRISAARAVNDVIVAAALAADGRALAGWATDGATVAAGRAGGAWQPAVTVSSPLRFADGPPTLALDAAGNPFAVWIELTQSTLEGRARGAKLVPDQALDTTAPTLTTRLPERVEVAKNGAFSFSVPVACDEACDVRVNVYDSRPHRSGYDLRELSLPAGGHATVRLSPSPYDERAFVKRQRPKRMRIVVEAADRAGNVATAAVTARVQRR